MCYRRELRGMFRWKVDNLKTIIIISHRLEDFKIWYQINLISKTMTKKWTHLAATQDPKAEDQEVIPETHHIQKTDGVYLENMMAIMPINSMEIVMKRNGEIIQEVTEMKEITPDQHTRKEMKNTRASSKKTENHQNRDTAAVWRGNGKIRMIEIKVLAHMRVSISRRRDTMTISMEERETITGEGIEKIRPNKAW